MTNTESKMGIFPRLLKPAQVAAERILAEGIEVLELKENPGLFVAKESDAQTAGIFFRFEHKGVHFAAFEMVQPIS